MFKQIFRITFLTFVWKQYKRLIISTLLLFAFLWIVGSVHQDYLDYARLQEDQSLVGLSFIYKWAAFAGGIALYLLFNVLLGRRAAGRPETSDSNTDTGVSKRRWLTSRRSEVADNAHSDAKQGPDPFAEIRSRKKLRTRGEIMMEDKDREQR